MDVNGVGWIAAIIIGGFAGWLAEQFMKSNMGLFMNIILGIIGAVVLNAILAFAGMGFTGWLAYLGHRLYRRLHSHCGWPCRTPVKSETGAF